METKQNQFIFLQKLFYLYSRFSVKLPTKVDMP